MFGMAIWNDYLKKKGKAGEDLVAKHYESLWYEILARNYTFTDWELDIVAIKWDILAFVEVKVVDHIEDIHGYLSPKKLWAVKRSIELYLYKHPHDKEISLDVAFVAWNSIVEIYENVTNT